MTSRRKKSPNNKNRDVNAKTRDALSDQFQKGIDSNGSIEKTLIDAVPREFEFNMPVAEPDKGVIETNKANGEAAEVLKNAKLAVINSYLKSEDNRLNLQLPLIKEIVNFTKRQLFFSNVVIVGIIITCVIKPDLEIIPQLIDFLKWYFGGTIIEFIGLIGIVTKGTFSDRNAKILEKLLNTKQEDSVNQIDKDSADDTFNN